MKTVINGSAQLASLSPIGATKLWNRSRTTFLCSNRCPGDVLLKAIDWVNGLDISDTVLWGGWHTPVEREVLRIALKRGIPVIIAEARAPRSITPEEWKTPLSEGRLLLIHPLPEAGVRITAAHAAARTKWVVEHSDKIVVAHVSSGGVLASALLQADRSRVAYLK